MFIRSGTYWILLATILKSANAFVVNPRSARMSLRSLLSSTNDAVPREDEPQDELVEAKKVHTMTVCMVPEAKYADVWDALTRARTELRDPGLYRWPSHANILYPFFDIKPQDSESINEEKLKLLITAVKKCEPFQVSLDSFGTFGGVLFLYPRSFRDSVGMQESIPREESVLDEEPLIQLQSLLQELLPECDDQKRNGKYTPHITLSHFSSLKDALDGQAKLETWWQAKEFTVHEIYVLKRVGDDGQFKILATLPLGVNSEGAQVHDPPIVFPAMPLVEEDWVRQERMAYKARRNGNGTRGKRRGRTRKKKTPLQRGPSKSRDTPEEIAKKRAERSTKRERLAQESAETGSDDYTSSLF